jgi:bifunctional DNA-binding transcriptional regulator/antitoxin component of YhaV-PrlF toxin-antitoxin module
MTCFATLSSKFRITLPKAVCVQQRWKAGQELVLIPKNKGSLVMPAPELNELAGIAQGARTDGYRDR